LKVTRSTLTDDEAPVLSMRDAARVLLFVVAPSWKRGLFLRRATGSSLADSFKPRSIELCQELRRRYGHGPVALPRPFGGQFLILSSEDARLILEGAPEPFTPATDAKRRALAHFEPKVSLITRGSERAPRRDFNERMLETDRRRHSLSEGWIAIVTQEVDALCARADVLTWEHFQRAWNRSVRQIVLGQAARDDEDLTAMLAGLRARANWVVLPLRRRLRARFHGRLTGYLARAEPGTLVAHAEIGNTPVHPSDQVAQWLFAFDAGAMTVWRGLAVILAHPSVHERTMQEINAQSEDYPYLHACFLDTVRLWPTTPLILRQASQTIAIRGVTIPMKSGLVIFVPYFHRDAEQVAQADRFDPDFWLDRDPAAAAPFLPFSAGPAACPGRHVVALLGALWLRALLATGVLKSADDLRLDPQSSMPMALDPFKLKFSRGTSNMLGNRISESVGARF
jgi:Cytochrome P450